MSIVLLQIGCKSKPRNPEAEVEFTLAQLEELVETKKLRAIKERVHSEYRDPDGRRKADLIAFLQLQFLRRSNIGVLSRIEALDVDTKGRSAEVILFAAAGSRITAGMASLRGISANVFRIELSLEYENEQWLLRSVDWRRARKADLTELLEGTEDD